MRRACRAGRRNRVLQDARSVRGGRRMVRRLLADVGRRSEDFAGNHRARAAAARAHAPERARVMAPGVREIPFDQWESFFERLAEERRGWLATIELLGPAGGRVQVEDAPFEGIVVDASGAAGGELSVLV